jgi:glycosyltransferase involved in cell wall biosynthesis
MSNAAEPIISIIIPVHNAMPYLLTSLASVMEQSIGQDRVEVVAVDDGSTDGSGAQLDLLAACWDGLRVVHQRPSGGPSGPRNTGLDLASGRYVFFLDADDYLASETLERMLALAEEGFDVVVGDRKEVGGRKLHIRVLFKPRHQTPGTSSVFRSWHEGPVTEEDLFLAAGSDCKHLYRRDRIERLGLRFPENVIFGEDSIFATGYAEGAKIGFVKNYFCYYERLRSDGTNLTTWLTGSEKHLDALERSWQLRADHQPRWRRDMLPRAVVLDLTRLVFNERFGARGPGERRRLVERARALLRTWLTAQAPTRLEALDRLKLDLISRGMEPELTELVRRMARDGRAKDTVTGGRVYGGYPFFGDPAVGIGCECYDVTDELPVRRHLAGLAWQGPVLRISGHAYIEHVDTVAASTELVLRRWGDGTEHRLPARQVPAAGLTGQCRGGQPGGGECASGYDYRLAGFEAEADTTVLAPGKWGVFVAVTAQGVMKQSPLGRSRNTAIGAAVGSPDGQLVACFTAYGTLTITAGAT